MPYDCQGAPLIQFIDLAAQQCQILPDGQSLRDHINSRIAAVLDHGKYILGPEVAELEAQLAAYVGVEHCITVASGTDALLISLMAIGVQAGDEVITTPFSFISTSETIALLGAVPVYVDIDPLTYNLDPALLDEAITPKTKAIIPVSLYGQPADFQAINAIAARHDLHVIEDGAQSFGATHHGRRSGSLSTIATTSFFPSKPLGGYGDAGACFTSDSDLAERMRRISRHGQLRRYFHTDLGLNGRIDTLQAAIVLAKFQLFEGEVKSRQQIAERYNQELARVGITTTPTVVSANTSVYAQYTVQVEDRVAVQDRLKQRGVPTAVHYPTLLSQQPVFAGSCTNHVDGSTSTYALFASKRVLSLPMHPYLTTTEQDTVVTALAASLG